MLIDFADIFKGFRRMEGKFYFEVDDLVFLVVMFFRRVLVVLKGKFKEEIDRFIDVGVLTKVEESIKWVFSVVITVKSNGKVRVCIDLRFFNEVFYRSYYFLFVIDDILLEFGKV